MENLRDILENNIVIVNFTKKDGSLRRMECTLIEDFLPKTTGTSNPIDGLITVYDIDNEGWRSFREDSIIDYEIAKDTT